jgi:hypothetical protein
MTSDKHACQKLYFTKNRNFAIIFLHINTTYVIQYEIRRGYKWLDQV